MNARLPLPLSLFLTCLVALPCGRAARNPAAPLNVLFFAVDDLNDWVGPLGGHPQVQTPNMDRLAARGVTFLNAHCQSPLCNPSRTSVLTGLRPSTTGVYGLNPWFRTAEPLKDLVTLPQHFMRNGYRVVTTGKIFHDAYPPREDRVDGREFTVWGHHGGFSPRPAKKFVDTPDKIALMDWGVFPERDEDCFDYDVASYAIDQLNAMPPGKPFFLCVGFRHPHVPCYAPQKWFDLYPLDTLQPPPVLANDRDDTPRFSWYLHWKLPEPRLKWLQEAGEWMPLVRAYLASVSFADAQVGRVMEALEATGHADDTVIVLWGDHGWHLGEKLISGKNSLWDRSTRVPLIFAGPGMARAGKCSQPVELLDLYPTLVELCGLPARDGLDGHSLVPQLEDPNARRAWPAITTHGPDNHGIRTERWRYIRYADGSEELYDLEADANEWTNVVARPENAAIKQRLARWLPQVNTAPVPGTVVRLIEIKEGQPFWEGKPIGPNDPIPD
ncbi:MAG: sulfatase [Verrucomicrobiae bacterium]|nr:sulfatase [Verrucomicrobiae bacterium]